MDTYDTLVIGGGQAGLAAGYHLKKQGLSFVILESRSEAVGSWPMYYDSLKLFSPARVSSLPGMKIPGDPKRYPLRDEVVQYLKQYQVKFQLPVQPNQHIDRVVRQGKGFTVYTTDGNRYQAQSIVNATGSFRNPYIPRITGHDTYQGLTLHASEYRRPQDYAGKRVVVVGRGNSAVQIAVELSDVSDTRLAVLQPVQFTKQRLFGLDLHLWVRAIGFDTFPFWRFGLKAPNPASVVDLDRYQEKLRAGKPQQQSMFISFYDEGVIWPDQKREQVDVVIFATGYRANLNHLREIGATDPQGNPLHRAGVSTTVPGLYYVGLYGQRSFASATIRGVGSDAKYVVNKIKANSTRLKSSN